MDGKVDNWLRSACLSHQLLDDSFVHVADWMSDLCFHWLIGYCKDGWVNWLIICKDKLIERPIYSSITKLLSRMLERLAGWLIEWMIAWWVDWLLDISSPGPIRSFIHSFLSLTDDTRTHKYLYTHAPRIAHFSYDSGFLNAIFFGLWNSCINI